MKTIWFQFLMLVVATVNAPAQNVKEILQSAWSGYSVQDGRNVTKDGKIYLTQKLKITIRKDHSLTGYNRTTFQLDGVSYTREVVLKGTYYPDRQEIFITDDYERSAEQLPNGLYWCGGSGYLKVYKNTNRPGHYLLKGTIRGYGEGCDVTNELELKDE